MSIIKRTKQFEDWMRRQTEVIDKGLAKKHEEMAESRFLFLRATPYDWIKSFVKHCPQIAKAPQVLALGDDHIGNYGVWLDAKGRAVFGINDFDDAYNLPYTLDLSRLATSIPGQFTVEFDQACASILKGYESALATGGKPILLEEDKELARILSVFKPKSADEYWKKIESLPACDAPESALQVLKDELPADSRVIKVVSRWSVGRGSLGRMRFAILAESAGERIGREVKVLIPSSAAWMMNDDSGKTYVDAILKQAIRARDPLAGVRGKKDKWILRGLSPASGHIETSKLDKLPAKDQLYILEAMGFDLGNIHLGTPEATADILADLNSRPKNWLLDTGERMVHITDKHWKVWREYFES
jgi:hypothetical protein